MKALPEGVRSWLAEQDIRAASYLSQLCAREGIPVRLAVDKDSVSQSQETCGVAIGLGFNGYTNLLAEFPFDEPLFRISWEGSSADPNLGKTDGLYVGEKKVKPPPKTARVDYCLIARLVRKPGRGRPFSRGEVATTGEALQGVVRHGHSMPCGHHRA